MIFLVKMDGKYQYKILIEYMIFSKKWTGYCHKLMVIVNE